VSLASPPLLQSWRRAGHRLAPPHLCRLDVVRDDVLDGPRLSRLRNRQGPGMGGEEGHCNAGQHQAREDRDGQDVLLDLLPPLRLGGPKHDALHAVVDPAARLEGDGVGHAAEVVEVRLEEPEGLRS
jgi:hypothetical protein